MQSVLDDVKCIAAIVALVAAVRSVLPKINGLWVLLLATGVGVGLAFLTGDTSMTWRIEVQRGILFGLTAVGAVTGADRHATKSGEATANAAARISRGFIRFEALVVALGAALIALVVATMIASCAGGPRCDAIQLQGCQLFTLKLPDDGGTLHVGRAELEEADKRTTARLFFSQDGGK